MKHSFLVTQTLIFAIALLLPTCGGTLEQTTVEVSKTPNEGGNEFEAEAVDPLDINSGLDFQLSWETTGNESQMHEEPKEKENLTKAEKIRLKKYKEAYTDAKMFMGTQDEELKIWKKFVKDHPGKDNPYLDEAKRKIESCQFSKPTINIPSRTKQRETKKGHLSEEQITETVHSHIAEVQFCYQKHLEDDPEMRGKIWVEFTVSTTGKVVSPEVVNSALSNAGVENCILECIRRWEFPKPEGGDTPVITYPFHFEAYKS